MSVETQSSVTLSNSKSVIAGYVVIAGGYQSMKSLEAFFSGAEKVKGLTYFVCAELPLRQSIHIYELLKGVGSMPVYAIDSTMILEPDSIYLCPSFSSVSIIGKQVTVEAVKANVRNRNTLNLLLEALSEKADQCALVSIAGTPLVESRAVSHFRGGGGLVLEESQAGVDAEVVGSMVDRVLEVGQMPGVLCEHFGLGDAMASDAEIAEQESLKHLFDKLSTRVKVDFSQYKTDLLKRRILNRMRRTEYTSIRDYIEFASDDAQESLALYDDFIVGVTRFFRNEDAFRALRDKVVPELFDRSGKGEEIRIWVPGVASGEEAYTIGILIEEHASRLGIENPKYKIFATDAHESALQTGVKAYYSLEALSELSPSRVERFFTRSKRHFQVASFLRKKIVFARHDILQDPPFSRIDFVSCRNLLIYLKPAAQKKAMGMMLFSMNLKGFLCLGSSESPNSYLGQLEVFDPSAKIYRKKSDTYISTAILNSAKKRLPSLSPPDRTSALSMGDHPEQVMLNSLMARYMPPSIVIDEIGEIIHTFGDCDFFMEPILGRASLHYEDRVRSGLRLSIHQARSRVLSANISVSCRCATMDEFDQSVVVDLEVEPLKGHHGFDNCVLVLFSRKQSSVSLKGGAVEVMPSDLNEPLAASKTEQSLREELKTMRVQLNETVMELESSNRELQLANEELLTSNEELQTTNEELHSVNEELFTVNAEYESKNRDLISLNEDINNLLSSTEIGTVFVDSNLRIRKFTPTAHSILNLLPTDIGRPIDHISHNLVGYDALVDDTKTVIEEGKSLEKEAWMEGGALLLVRILPFKTGKEEVTGAVIALIDITEMKQAEIQYLDSQRRLQLALEAADFGVWSFEVDTGKFECDSRVERFFGLSGCSEEERDAFLRKIEFTKERFLAKEWTGKEPQEVADQATWSFTLPSGELRYVSTRALVYRGVKGYVERVSGVMWDETDAKQGEQQILQKKKDLETLLYVVSHDLREPLRAIQSFSTLLADRYREQIEGKGADFISRIEGAAKRMTTLLDDVLSLSRINKMRSVMERVSGSDLVDAVLRELDTRIQETGAEIVVSSDLPELRANYTYAKQAISNLIGNALKFVNPGEVPKIDISPYVTSGNQFVGIEVRDRGPGIPEESLERVFKLFQRAVGRDVEGTGAGLAIVKQIAQKHGGDVWYEPRRGGGSKFTITFSNNS